MTKRSRAYQRLIEQGKIRWCGASNLDAGQLQAALKVASQKKLPRYEVLQPEYNLYDRSSFDGPLRDLCMREDIGVITYFSLAKGFLTGKYRSEADLGKSPRGGGVSGLSQSARHAHPGRARCGVGDAMAPRRPKSRLRGSWRSPGITAPIASATTIEQTDSLIRSRAPPADGG